METETPAVTARELLRHALAVVAYRGAKAFRGVPPSFGNFKVTDDTRVPVQILAHVNDLYDWALTMARGEWKWSNSTPSAWEAEVARFHAGLAALDAYLEGDAPLGYPAEKFIAGPVADSLTHIGQINLLRRLAGSPVKGESYARALIVTGRVGAIQSPPRVEFD
ncbi:MAG: hypothetical protein P3A28_09080 [Gemmatimonadota bacterium]|nr:hypothetical protein [Gemmatimonadota bacterium]